MMPADAPTSPLEEAKPVHARWSEVNRQLLEFAAANPECMDRDSYAVVSQAPGLQTYASVQPWPLFFEPPRLGVPRSRRMKWGGAGGGA